MQDTWIIVADGASAQIYLYQGKTRFPKRIEELTHVNKPSQELVTTKRGRMPDTGEGQRSALDRPTDPHTYEKTVFARKLMEFLEERESSIDRLVIVAAPKMLGTIRQLLPESLLEKVSAELDKDLTNIPEQELPKHLQAVLNFDANLRHDPD